MITRYWRKTILASVTTLISVMFATAAFAYPTYSGCKGCHGDFRDDNYVSRQDNAAWGQSLMSGHLSFFGDAFIGDKCGSCHNAESESAVFLNASSGSSLSKSCVGCHGRQENVTGNCVGDAVSLECGSGAGLRQHHLNYESSIGCDFCHSDDPVPVGEQTNPYNYGVTGVVMQDACDADGTESQFGSTGLDNDGDGDRDRGDSDCGTIFEDSFEGN